MTVAQQLEGHVRQLVAGAAAEGQQGAGQRRQRVGIRRLAEYPGEEGFTPGFARFRVDHLQHVRQGRLVADRGLQQLALAGAVQPRLHQALGLRTERFATGHAAAQDLHHVAQHLAVVHHLAENRRQQGGALRRQGGHQQGRHVLHVAGTAGVHGGLGHEGRVQLGHQGQHLGQLLGGVGVEGLVQATGHRQLGQLVLRLQGVGTGLAAVVRIHLRQAGCLSVEEGGVGHRGVSLCCPFVDRDIASGVPVSFCRSKITFN